MHAHLESRNISDQLTTLDEPNNANKITNDRIIYENTIKDRIKIKKRRRKKKGKEIKRESVYFYTLWMNFTSASTFLIPRSGIEENSNWVEVGETMRNEKVVRVHARPPVVWLVSERLTSFAYRMTSLLPASTIFLRMCASEKPAHGIPSRWKQIRRVTISERVFHQRR